MLQLILYEISNISLSQRYVIGYYTPTTYEFTLFQGINILRSQLITRRYVCLERPKYESDLPMC